MREDTGYYADFARACDEVLHSTSCGEYELIQVVLTNSVLPETILRLHPSAIWITSKSVSIDLGREEDGFWIGWGPAEGGTNLWSLEAGFGASRRILHSETR